VAGLADELAQVPLFSGLNQRQLKKLARSFKERRLGPGISIVHEGQMDGVGFFVIAEGNAAVSVDGTIVATLGPGDHFGELAMISEQARGATVTAETNLRLLVMAFWDFRKFAKENPDVSWKLLQYLAGLLIEDRARRARAALQSS
jgi:CRP/FNR family transcriptional regulator, cyclic AMP receptor protein